ncbi:ankyrin repeat domain-containing protein [Candidatus Dependentiae bacterium]|nr:ankyrin repeat domain-containing protein [Candidatus Dependentiae bacterium]
MNIFFLALVFLASPLYAMNNQTSLFERLVSYLPLCMQTQAMQHQARRDAQLLEASKVGNAQDVKILLNQGANPNKVSSDGTTPLFAAASNGHTKVIQLLLTASADLEKTCHCFISLSSPEQSLFMPLKAERLDIGQMLLDISAGNTENYTPLEAAKLNQQTQVIRIITKYSTMLDKATDNPTESALRKAIVLGYTDIVEKLLKRLTLTHSQLQAYNRLAYHYYKYTCNSIYKKIGRLLLREIHVTYTLTGSTQSGATVPGDIAKLIARYESTGPQIA